MQSKPCKNGRLDEAQVGIKIAGRNINNLRYADDTTLMVEIKEGKNLVMPSVVLNLGKLKLPYAVGSV